MATQPFIGLPLQQTKWAITELNDNDPSLDTALEFDTLISFDISADAEAPSEAVEKGSFATYNKISSPREITTQVARSGTPEILEIFIAQLEKWRNEAILVNFLTPEIEYFDITLTSYSYTRTRDQGEGVLIVDLTFVEVRQVETQYTTVTVPPIKTGQAKNPTDATPIDRGQVQTEDASIEVSGLGSFRYP